MFPRSVAIGEPELAAEFKAEMTRRMENSQRNTAYEPQVGRATLLPSQTINSASLIVGSGPSVTVHIPNQDSVVGVYLYAALTGNTTGRYPLAYPVFIDSLAAETNPNVSLVPGTNILGSSGVGSAPTNTTKTASTELVPAGTFVYIPISASYSPTPLPTGSVTVAIRWLRAAAPAGSDPTVANQILRVMVL